MTVQFSRYSTQRLLVYDKKNIAINHDVQMCPPSIFSLCALGLWADFFTKSYLQHCKMQNVNCRNTKGGEENRNCKSCATTQSCV